MNDLELKTLLRDAGEPMPPATRESMRRTLTAVLRGESPPRALAVVTPVDGAGRRPTLWMGISVAAAIAIAATTAVVLHLDDSSSVTPAAPTHEPTATNPPGAIVTPVSNATVYPALFAVKRAIDFDGRSLFGFRVGRVDSYELAAAVSFYLGPPTLDTDWFMTASEGNADCLGDTMERILRWDDVVFAFRRDLDSDQTSRDEYLWTWRIGDDANAWIDLHEPKPYTGPADSAIRTVDGAIGIGSTSGELDSHHGRSEIDFDYGDPISNAISTTPLRGTLPSLATPNLSPNTTFVDFVLADDRITAIGSTDPFC